MTRLQLTAEDLLAGSAAVYDVDIPHSMLNVTGAASNTSAASNAASNVDAASGTEAAEMTVRLRPITIGQFILIMKAAKEDASLIPLLMVKESLVEPEMSLSQVKQMS